MLLPKVITVRFHGRAAYHDLMPNAITCREVWNSLLLPKRSNVFVLRKVGCRLVLDIVVDCEDQLVWVSDALGTKGAVFVQDCRRIVVGHAPVRFDLYIVAAAKELSLWQTDSVGLNNLFRQRLRRLWHL